MNLENKKPVIHYPTKWEYKIIGKDAEELISAIEETVIGLEYEVRSSNISREEKYLSLNLTVHVPSEIVRDIIFQKLNSHPAVNYVI